MTLERPQEQTTALAFRVQDGQIGIRFDDELQGLGQVLISVQDVAIKTAVVTHPGVLYHQDGNRKWHRTEYKIGDRIIVSRLVGHSIGETKVINNGVYGKWGPDGIVPTKGCVIFPWYRESQYGSFTIPGITVLLRGILGKRQYFHLSKIVGSARADLPVGTDVQVSPDLPGMVLTSHDVPCIPKDEHWKISGLMDNEAADDKDKLEFGILVWNAQ